MNIFDVIVVQPIFNLLILIYSLIPGGDFGISLILFTVLVRLLMWPLVKKQLHQVKIMRKLQPELVKVKKQAKGNKQLETMQMMELYKKHGVNPFRSIGLLLIQLPIFIALYSVIQIFTLHRDRVASFTYDFLEKIGPIQSLIQNPNNFNEKLFGLIDLTQHPISAQGINIALVIIALLAAGLQYIMAKQTAANQPTNGKGLRQVMAEAAEGKSVDQGEMNAIVMGKMMKVLPVLILFVMLGLPGALGLYQMVSSAVAVVQQHILLKQDEQEMEAIADKGTAKSQKPHKKATAKARAKVASEATVTRITAKDGRSKKEK